MTTSIDGNSELHCDMTLIKEKLEEEYKENIPARVKEHILQKAQEDQELAERILLDGKTLSGAFDYAKEKARALAINGVAVVDDKDVYQWLTDYYRSEKIEKERPAIKTKIKKREAPIIPKKEEAPEAQLSLFDLNEVG